MKKEWFVLHSLTGQENKAQLNIVARVKQEAMEEYVGQCVIPTEKVTEKRDGKTRTYKKRYFPGYVLCELALYDETKPPDPLTGKRAIYERTWQFLRETPGIIGFVGTDRNNPNPIPLKQSEVDAILTSGTGGKSEQSAVPLKKFNVGDVVKVKDGAFMGQQGSVIIVDPGKGKLTVEVQIFGRKNPVEVENWQVEKMTEEELLASNPLV